MNELAPFDIREHIEKLNPTKEKNRYHCPACGGNDFTISPKTGAYQCWSNSCANKDIRDAIAPLKKDDWDASKLQKIGQIRQSKETQLNVAEVKAQVDHFALLVFEGVYTSSEAHIALSEWCGNQRDRYAASKLLQERLEANPGTFGLEHEAQKLKALVSDYANETDLAKQFLLKRRLQREYSLKPADIQALIADISPDAQLKTEHISEVQDTLGNDFLTRQEKLQADEIPPGISTGYRSLDNLLGGIQPSNLIFVAGRTSMGKSTFTTDICRHVVKTTQKPCVIFSLEMSAMQLKERWVAAESNVPLTTIRKGKKTDLQNQMMIDALAKIYDLPIYIDQSSAITIDYLNRACQSIKSAHDGLSLVVIDYLNLMKGDGSKQRVQEVSELARGLQNSAKILNVPMVVLSQLNRSGDGRKDKEPQLSDLRESGEIEQVADAVLMLYRPGKDDDKEQHASTTKLYVRKNRHGPIGEIDLIFDAEYSRFLNAPVSIG